MSREQDDLDQLKYIQEWTKKQAKKKEQGEKNLFKNSKIN